MNMTRNLGRTDRILRFFIGLILIVAPLLNIPQIWSTSLAAGIAIAVGAILIFTSFFKFCPLYRVFGLSTCKIQ